MCPPISTTPFSPARRPRSARSCARLAHRELPRHAPSGGGIPVYLCDPASPWQRGSNENTNGLLGQYFPKAINLAARSPEHLAAVAAELNGRPRKTLGWDTPAERLAKLLDEANSRPCCDDS
jgi:IS30 family transposase